MAKTIENFDIRMRKAMEYRGMRQVDLVNATGIDKSSISHYLSATHSPTTDKIYKIAKALGVSEAWLLGYDVPMEITNQNINDMVARVGENKNFDTLIEIISRLPEESVNEVIRYAQFIENNSKN